MNLAPRLLRVRRTPETPSALIRNLKDCGLSHSPEAWVEERHPKRWPDLLGNTPIPSESYLNTLVVSGRVVADLLESGLADGEFLPLEMEACPVRYFLMRPRTSIWEREVDVSAKLGCDEPAFAPVPDYTDYLGHAFTLAKDVKRRNDERSTSILCIPAISALAKEKGWIGVTFDEVGGGLPLFERDERGRVREFAERDPNPVDGYYVAEDVIAADLARARQLAAELQNSPDTPEWTRRSFEIVRKALVEAPHALGYPAPAPAKPRRKSRSEVSLLSSTAIKRLQLGGEGEFEIEVELGRPLFGSDTLSLTVSDEVVDDDAPEISFTTAELKRRAQAVLEKLEGRLPAIEAAIDELAASHEKSPADFRATLHDPGVFLCTADMVEGERWAFVVEDDLVSHFFEFDGDTVIEVWSGD